MPKSPSRHAVGLVPDVVLLILELLQDDKPALYACSLISSIWRPIAQQFLLSSAFIYISVPLRAPAHFLSFLDSCHHLHRHIRKLHISSTYRHGFPTGSAVLSLHDLVSIPPRLSRLRLLHIGNVSFLPNDPFNETILPTITVDSLRLSETNFYLTGRNRQSDSQADSLRNLLRAFAFIRTLHFDNIIWTYPNKQAALLARSSDVLKLSSIPLVHVAKLRVADVDAMQVFLRCISTSDIQHLQLTDHGGTFQRYHERYQRYLDLMPQLKELTVYFPHRESVPPLCPSASQTL